jgi:saccharopine dehydrogenase (NAD+, L-lysine-forming)
MSYSAVVLGGCGRMGTGSVQLLLADDQCARVGVADARADRLGHRLPEDAKVESPVALDVSNSDELVRLIAGYDVVVNAVGPYYRHGTTVLDAAITAGVDYVDLCDDLEPTRRMLDRSEAAAVAGITAVVGCGTSPGATNMIVAAAAEAFDELLEARISWVVPMQDAGGLAVGLHALHMLVSEVYRVVDGRGEFGTANTRAYDVDFPSPYRAVRVHEVGHPEPYTLHREFPSLQTVWNAGAVYPYWAMERLLAAATLGLADDEPLRIGDQDVAPGRIAIALDVRHRDRNRNLPLGPEVSYARVEVVGRTGDAERKEAYLAPDRMSEGAGGGAAVAAGLVAGGETKARGGVFAPESVFVPMSYFAAMECAGLHIQKVEQPRDAFA